MRLVAVVGGGELGVVPAPERRRVEVGKCGLKACMGSFSGGGRGMV